MKGCLNVTVVSVVRSDIGCLLLLESPGAAASNRAIR
jgi:hypothetical protein